MRDSSRCRLPGADGYHKQQGTLHVTKEAVIFHLFSARRIQRMGAVTLASVSAVTVLAAAPATAAALVPPILPPVTSPALNEVGLPTLQAAGSATMQAKSMFDRAAQLALSPSQRAQAKKVYAEGLSLWRSAQSRAAAARAEHAAAGAARKLASSPSWKASQARFASADMAARSSEARARAVIERNSR